MNVAIQPARDLLASAIETFMTAQAFRHGVVSNSSLFPMIASARHHTRDRDVGGSSARESKRALGGTGGRGSEVSGCEIQRGLIAIEARVIAVSCAA
jgi:hypothetical protein